MRGTIDSAVPGTFESDTGGTFNPLLSHYAWIDVDYIINHDECPILSLYALEEAMPDFRWDGGHSGRELPMKDAIILEGMWLNYLESHKEFFDGLRARSRKKMK